MINNNEVNKLLNEHRQSKSDFERLNALTSLREILENEIKEIARKMR